MFKAPAGAVLAALVFAAVPAHAERRVVDRVVARVNSRPILLSEIRARLRPYAKSEPAWRRADAVRRYWREILEHQIDEALIGQIAEQKSISVSDRDVDQALDAFAKQRKLSVDALLAEALAYGYSERMYRAEVRRSLFEQRVVYALADTTDFPKQEAARQRWYDREKARVLARAREQACIERLSR